MPDDLSIPIGEWVPPTHDSYAAIVLRHLTPHLGWCFRCGMPWSKVKPHVTNYTITQGCFPLCEGCWTKLGSPEARIEYYKMLIDHWQWSDDVTEEEKFNIKKAVANGG